MPLPTPPVVPGLPLIGNAIDFRRNPVNVLLEGYQRFGPIFAIRLGPMRAAVLIGPEMNRFVFDETDHILSMSEAYQAFVPIFGEGFTLAVPPAEYQEQRAILAPAFQPQKMTGYVETMITQVRAWVDGLGTHGTFDLVEALERLAVNTTAAALMGQEFHRRMGPDFEQLYRDVVRGIDVMLPPYLPLPRFRRRDRARQILHTRIRALIEERRAQAGGHDDFLQYLAEARYSDGALMDMGKLESMILFLVFSASESTPLQASWALIHLLQHPTYLERVLQEQAARLGPQAVETLSADSLRQLQHLEWALKESERIRPMTTMLWRTTTQAYDAHGYHVPQGWMTIMCPAVTHRIPEIFPNPDVYDPDRFGPQRAEDRQTPYALTGFGGGRHKCPGVSFAYNFMKVIFTLLLERYSLTLVNPDPQPDYSSAIARPQAPCLVRYRERVRPSWQAAPAAAAACPYHHEAAVANVA